MFECIAVSRKMNVCIIDLYYWLVLIVFCIITNYILTIHLIEVEFLMKHCYLLFVTTYYIIRMSTGD
jgi:hypothetical protein